MSQFLISLSVQTNCLILLTIIGFMINTVKKELYKLWQFVCNFKENVGCDISAFNLKTNENYVKSMK